MVCSDGSTISDRQYNRKQDEVQLYDTGCGPVAASECFQYFCF